MRDCLEFRPHHPTILVARECHPVVVVHLRVFLIVVQMLHLACVLSTVRVYELADLRRHYAAVLGDDDTLVPVDRVEGQLRRRLADGLGGQSTHHLPWVHETLDVAVPYVLHDLVKDLLRHAVLENAPPRGEVEPQQAVEESVLDHVGLLDELRQLFDDVGRRQVRLGRVRIAVPVDEPLKMDRSQDTRLFVVREDLVHQHVAILDDLVHQVRRLAAVRCVTYRRHVRRRQGIPAIDLFEGQQGQIDRLRLYLRRVHAVLAVAVLYDHARVVPHRAIVGCVHVLHRLHHLTLYISGIARLDGCIDQTLAAAHRVEEVLGRTQALHERALDKAPRLDAVVKLGEVRQRAVLQRVLHTLAVDNLLPQQGNHLRNVQAAALGSRLDHLHEAVLAGQRLRYPVCNLGRNVLERVIYLILQLLAVRAARDVDEASCVDVRQNLLHPTTPLRQRRRHEVYGLCIRNEIRRTRREPRIHVEFCNNRLHLVDELAAPLRAKVVEQDVQDTLRCCVERTLFQQAFRQPAVFDSNPLVKVHERESGRDDVHTCMFFSSGHEGRQWPPKLGHDVHHDVLGNASLWIRDAEGSRKSVLNHLNDGSVLPRTDN